MRRNEKNFSDFERAVIIDCLISGKYICAVAIELSQRLSTVGDS